MKSFQLILVAAGLAALSACSSNDSANNADANIALESENLDVAVNADDVSLNADVNAVDANAADANAAAGSDANAVDSNASTNSAQ